jgi:hypothetical protein
VESPIRISKERSMNTSQVINAAREAIIAKGLEVQTSISSDTSLLLGVRSKRHHRVFGPATPLVCWTDAFEYATGKSWVSLLTNWRKTAPVRPAKIGTSNRGELMLIAGNALAVEKELNELENSGKLLSAVYTRRGQRQTIVHAEVI